MENMIVRHYSSDYYLISPRWNTNLFLYAEKETEDSHVSVKLLNAMNVRALWKIVIAPKKDQLGPPRYSTAYFRLIL